MLHKGISKYTALALIMLMLLPMAFVQADEPSTFLGFVLLDDPAFDLEALVQTLNEEWGLVLPEENTEKTDDILVTTINGITVFVAFLDFPIPDQEAEHNAQTNFLWPDAVSVAETHKAHVVIGVTDQEKNVLDAGALFVKISAACLQQPNAMAIYTLGTVFSADFYIETAQVSRNRGEFPVYNLVFIGLYSSDQGETISGYTYGLGALGRQEIEILNSSQESMDVMELLYDIASYVLNGAMLQSGETLGYTAEQKLLITESPGVGVEGMTLKIGF